MGHIEWTAIITALISSLALVLPSLLALSRQRKKDHEEIAKAQAETADKIIATSQQQVAISLSLIEPLRESVTALSGDIKALEKKVRVLRDINAHLRERNIDLEEICSQLFRGCGRLVRQVRERGDTPKFKVTDVQSFAMKPVDKS